MNQLEMSRYLKLITIGTGILFFLFTAWFFPTMIWKVALVWPDQVVHQNVYIGIWITAIPAFLCLWKFWGICDRIGKNESFSKANAKALKQMSHFILIDALFYVMILAAFFIKQWYEYFGLILLFGIIMILIICIVLAVLCASLSHLVYKASKMQEDQDLTI